MFKCLHKWVATVLIYSQVRILADPAAGEESHTQVN
eukprot:COSAG06_NODE_46966_length_342_cov_8919.909465_1_plen_35_part_10